MRKVREHLCIFLHVYLLFLAKRENLSPNYEVAVILLLVLASTIIHNFFFLFFFLELQVLAIVTLSMGCICIAIVTFWIRKHWTGSQNRNSVHSFEKLFTTPHFPC